MRRAPAVPRLIDLRMASAAADVSVSNNYGPFVGLPVSTNSLSRLS